MDHFKNSGGCCFVLNMKKETFSPRKGMDE